MKRLAENTLENRSINDHIYSLKALIARKKLVHHIKLYVIPCSKSVKHMFFYILQTQDLYRKEKTTLLQMWIPEVLRYGKIF